MNATREQNQEAEIRQNINATALKWYGFSQDELEAAFKAVQAKTHWKDPIDAVVMDAGQIPVVTEAIIHFTATTPTFTALGFGRYQVTAAGYRNGPAGDH